MIFEMLRKNIFAVCLALLAIGLFLLECFSFHFNFFTGTDALIIAALVILPGLLIVPEIRFRWNLELSLFEVFSVSSAIGFGIIPFVLAGLHRFDINPRNTTIVIMIIAIFQGLLWNPKMRHRYFDGWSHIWKTVLGFTIGALVFFAAYNLTQFHYGPDGSIITHGLFGVDIPFLAGEIHGIRDFGTLRDLHQSAQAWHYHDWTYQLLALLPKERTLPDLAFAAPLVGYVLLAVSIFALAFRISGSKYTAYISVGVWFLVSGISGVELGSYALSPSFVFGSMILVNLLLVFDLRMKAREKKPQWVFSGIFFILLFELSQTKLSSYLAIVVAVGLIGLMGLIVSPSKRKTIMQLLGAAAVSFAIVLWQNAGANPLMPSGDFVIGAPLLGYANHIAALLHIPLSSINPVSHGLRWQSVFIVPFFIFHFLRFALVDPKLLSALIALIIFRNKLWKDSHELMWILFLLLPIGFLLPVLYSPAWYPLALSFYAPLVSAQASFFIVTIALGIFAKDQKAVRKERTALGIIGLIFLIGIALNVRDIIAADGSKASIVQAPLIHALNYLEDHSTENAIIATHRFDLDSLHDESYYWYSALSGRSVISEGAKYGSLLAAVADTNSEKGLHPVPAAEHVLADRRAMLDSIFGSRNSQSIESALAATKASYILETPTDRTNLPYPSLIADSLFSDGGYTVWKVRNSP